MFGTVDLLLLLAAVAPSIVKAHPGGGSLPRLYGRNGLVDLDSLPPLVKRAPSPDGTCGGTNAYTCGGAVGNCCSAHGWCGNTDAYCLPASGCQAAFGVCTGSGTTTASTANPTAMPTDKPVTPNGRCGPLNGGYKCGATVDRCCSQNGWCGDSTAHCLISQNCNPEYGICTGAPPPTTAPPTTMTMPPAPSSTTSSTTSGKPISPNLRCGPLNGGYACGPTVDRCCSQNGWCGDSDAHCLLSQNCNPEYGMCKGATTTTVPPTTTTTTTPPTTTTTAPPTTTTTTTSTPPTSSAKPISPNLRCGPLNGGYACGPTVDRCCSQNGWCGDSDAHCLLSQNCNPEYGMCKGATTTTTTTSGSTTTTSGSPTSTTRPVSPNGQCGPTNGYACPAPQCCSLSGNCGTTIDYCSSPDCQVTYGKCDADATPSGASTDNIARPNLGSIPYGSNIYDCVVPGDIALTFDDGPYTYTDGMVTLLNSYNARATFFITGVNSGKGAIDTTPAWNAVIKRMAAGGHQLASHTWSHANLNLLGEAQRRAEMIKLEMALRNIVGYFPTYMRPPYSECGDVCLQTMRALGYHVTSFNVDTDDYNQDSPEKIQVSKNIFASYVNPSNVNVNSFLVIAHDVHEQTATNLTDYMLRTLTTKGYKAVTVGECLGDPKANWYRTA